jgi:methylated-DNA-[protein]-cysteine S-methyltransferase
MNAKPPETFGLDRLQTPIGVALLVTDADGALRALDWEDYEPRLRQLLRLQYGATVLRDAWAPDDIRSALSRYFKGELGSLAAIKWRVAGTAFQRKVWTALTTIPAGTTLSYGALAAELGMPKGGACGRPCQRLQSDQRRGALPSRDRGQRLADRLRRRP